jgi:hypothetical protein
MESGAGQDNEHLLTTPQSLSPYPKRLGQLVKLTFTKAMTPAIEWTSSQE